MRFAAACVVLAAIALPLRGDWERTRQPDGTYACTNEQGVTLRPDAGTIKSGCENFTQHQSWVEALLGMSIAEAQFALILPPQAEPPPPDPFPADWSDVSIGTGVNAELTYDGGEGEFGINDTGGNVFVNADRTRVFARTRTGDMTLTARVTATDIDGDPVAAKAFLMVRESTAAGSRNVHAGIRGASGRRVYERAETDGSTSTLVTDSSTTTLPMCFRISVDADNESVRLEQSANCSDYTVMGSDLVRSWLGAEYTVAIGGSANNDADPTATNHVVWDTVSYSTASVDHVGSPTSDTPEYDDPLDGVTVGTQTIVSIANNAALDAAISSGLLCGRDYELAAGTYSGTKTIDDGGACANTAPIRIVGAGSWASVATGQWNLTGTRVYVTGVYFNGPTVYCEGYLNKLLGNRFANTANSPAVRLEANDSPATDYGCEVSYNLFEAPGATCYTTAAFKQAIKMFTSGGAPSVMRDVWILRNLFDGWTSTCNQGDLIELGVSATYTWYPSMRSGGYIQENLIDGFDGGGSAEVMDTKVGGVKIIGNTVINSGSNRVQFRVGQEGIADGNYLADGAGLTIIDAYHKAVCNNVTGTLRVHAGDHDTGDIFSNGYARARETFLGRNIAASTRIGFAFNPATQTLSAIDTTIMQHTGSIVMENEDGTVDDRAEESTYDCIDAVELTSSDVGPGALSSADAGWQAARGF